MSKTILVNIFIGVMLFTGCDLPHQPGPMPTDLVETEFQPGLNILGVLRADDQAGSSFINVNRAMTTEEIYVDSIENLYPDLDYLQVYSRSFGHEYTFLELDSVGGEGNYRDTSLNVVAGETYTLEISAPGFPILTGETTVPIKPQLLENTLTVSPGYVSCQLEHDSGTFEYKLYLIFADDVLEKVVTPSGEDVIDVVWTFSASLGDPLNLMLSALDENLTRYGNSPISFLPNTYHADGSTVTGGYGCFGSVAITYIEL